ncbi:MAG: diadenylate cyclase CdaA [Lachnospiraceae bacterium]|jgi:diadenylate cyclase|nr:diadenylate cyclase CdaA [Lachnospiraceae bacterium]
MFENISKFLDKYIPVKFVVTDAIEIIILAIAFYEIMIWIRKTKAWILLKGIVAIIAFMLIASIFHLDTILWIIKNVLSMGVLALVIIFQPELRKALEQIGKKNILSNILSLDSGKKVNERFSDKTINEFIKATAELGRTKTGALIVIEQDYSLAEYIRTGIDVDAVISSQLLINIFEHNTPLHDGAVIVSGNRIVSATCYLPLSENMGLSKDLGTRHRAGVGISENTDAFTIIVSEETGKISVTEGGNLYRNISGDELKKMLIKVQDKTVEHSGYFKNLRGKRKNEKKANQ